MVGAWCSPCLLTALFMLIMIPLSVDEIAAMAQFMGKVRRDDKLFWAVFWRGGTPDEKANGEDRTTFHAPAGRLATDMARGVSVPWNLLVATLIGFWLMATPDIFGSSEAAATSGHLVGPLVAVIAVCAMAEIIRSLRFFNILTRLWLLATAWWLPGAVAGSIVTDLIAGVLLIALSLARGPIHQRYGGWDGLTR